ncbi:S-methyl-5-thioribose-1-phosphate isomerase [Fontivita pretiosa]|uniref:S-methyl-5-thioribose-1-phosphate isomerase n=1 Tax=Fontivita pretiosa TaxID=2989684 RepID=UPI003D17163F
MLKTIEWTGNAVRLLDQTKLPTETRYVEITDERQMWDAIRRLVVRGAPAIGVAAAFGVYLGIRHADENSFDRRLDEICDYLASSRPTAVNLFWALDRIKRVVNAQATGSLASRKQRILDECLAMIEEDIRACRAIGEHGLALLRSLRGADASGPKSQPWHILTHCNAGALATVQYGTALAPIYVGIEQGLRFHVFVDETRPLLQGSRITAYELKHNGVPVTVLCDNMAATLMSQRKLDAVIVGADRIAANGDTANKVGTLGLAIVARHFGVPFFVAAPTSTIDRSIDSGAQIPIEQRDPKEISHGFGRQTAPDGVDFFNPAFDVTPAGLIDAIITERGVLRPPYDLKREM